mmetsp:Transcript_8412/g.17307  ORF Transcript_8412/g.17307 Transcript_8412/m.17307 type:complete len:182 (+) Transcript_8412:182-727(+)
MEQEQDRERRGLCSAARGAPHHPTCRKEKKLPRRPESCLYKRRMCRSYKATSSLSFSMWREGGGSGDSWTEGLWRGAARTEVQSGGKTHGHRATELPARVFPAGEGTSRHDTRVDGTTGGRPRTVLVVGAVASSRRYRDRSPAPPSPQNENSTAPIGPRWFSAPARSVHYSLSASSRSVLL